MKPVALILAATLLAGSALAQQADPALDDLGAPPAGPSELDILSQGANSDFPEIDEVSKRKPVSVTLRALNKVTAKYVDFTINMNETASFGTIEMTPRYCDKRPPEEFPETTAFVEIIDKAGKPISDFKDPALQERADKAAAEAAEMRAVEIRPGVVRSVDIGQSSTPISTTAAPATPVGAARALPDNMFFSGWMFKSSPALNGVQHPVYDVWVIDCKTVNVDN